MLIPPRITHGINGQVGASHECAGGVRACCCVACERVVLLATVLRMAKPYYGCVFFNVVVTLQCHCALLVSVGVTLSASFVPWVSGGIFLGMS
jgi:hypothetical protein